MTSDEDTARREKLKDWIIRPEHFKLADKDAAFIYTLPIDRTLEAREEVIDRPQPIIYDEAETRLHIQKAILSLIMS